MCNGNTKKMLKNNNLCLLASLLTPLLLVIRQVTEGHFCLKSRYMLLPAVPDLKFCFKELQFDPTS